MEISNVHLYQTTKDRKIRAQKSVILSMLTDLSNIIQNEDMQKISRSELRNQADTEIRLSSQEYMKMSAYLDNVVPAMKDTMNISEVSDFGGSTLIAAIAAQRIGGPGKVYIAANIFPNQKDLLSKKGNEDIKEMVRGCPMIDNLYPGTTSFEPVDNSHKIMFSSSEGRGLDEYDWRHAKHLIDSLIKQGPVINIFNGNGKNPVEKNVGFREYIADGHENLLRAECANSFNGKSRMYKLDSLNFYLGADIASFNDQEVKDLYLAAGGKTPEMGIVHMLKDLYMIGISLGMDVNKDIILTAHSSSGRCVIPFGASEKIPFSDLQYASDLSVDAAAARILTGEYATQDKLTSLIKKELVRQYEPFQIDFGRTEGVVCSVSWDLSKHKVEGGTTGAGASSDGSFVRYASAPMAKARWG